MSTLVSLALLAALAAGGYYTGRYGPEKPEEPGRNEALYASLLSFLSFPAGLGYGFGRWSAKTQGRRDSKEKENSTGDANGVSMSKKAMDEDMAFLTKILLGALGVVAALGGSGYLIGRYGPEKPHEPGDNEAIHAALLNLLPPAGFGYGFGRRVALRHLNESKPKGEATKPPES